VGAGIFQYRQPSCPVPFCLYSMVYFGAPNLLIIRCYFPLFVPGKIVIESWFQDLTNDVISFTMMIE
jgi:hypothetical protein